MSQERAIKPLSGWGMLGLNLVLLLAAIGMFAFSIGLLNNRAEVAGGLLLALSIPWAIVVIISLRGHFIVQPNHAKVLLLFGTYRGSVRDSGFYWANPFLSRIEMSLRLRNLDGQHLKVNDRNGNPIEIAAVVVWRVHDTAEAAFDVDDFVQYVKVQSEAAVRNLASHYAYDHGEEQELTLRGSPDEVAATLQHELQARLAKAGVTVEEARLSHLAYAPEIAGAMLRRQQADAIIAARQRIVHGAVSMVEMALKELETKEVVDLDPERRAAMVSNLLVVLCGESEATPVINAGTLYT